jgi:hypothetical protein
MKNNDVLWLTMLLFLLILLCSTILFMQINYINSNLQEQQPYNFENTKVCKDGFCTYKYKDNFAVCYSLYSSTTGIMMSNNCFILEK